MKKIIPVFLLFLSFLQPLQAYNETERKQAAILAATHLATAFLPDSWFGVKFSTQFGIGIHDPKLAVVALGMQHALLGDQVALSSGLSMANRAIALESAQYFNLTPAMGYLLAAGLDTAAIWMPPGPFGTSLLESKLISALSNVIEQALLKTRFSPETVGLLTSAVTSALAGSLWIAYSGQYTDPEDIEAQRLNLNAARALVAETAFRLGPSLATMYMPTINQQANLALGVPLILLATRMKKDSVASNLVNLVSSTGCAFLINSVVTWVGQLMELVT